MICHTIYHNLTLSHDMSRDTVLQPGCVTTWWLFVKIKAKFTVCITSGKVLALQTVDNSVKLLEKLFQYPPHCFFACGRAKCSFQLSNVDPRIIMISSYEPPLLSSKLHLRTFKSLLRDFYLVKSVLWCTFTRCCWQARTCPASPADGSVLVISRGSFRTDSLKGWTRKFLVLSEDSENKEEWISANQSRNQLNAVDEYCESSH